MSTVVEPTNENIAKAAEIIRSGGVVVCPSDTNLALTLNPWKPEAVERAFAIKNRPANQPLTLFVENPEDWRLYGIADDETLVDNFVKAFWPGPLNIILPKTDAVPEAALKGSDTVSIGCLSNTTPRRLIHEVGFAVAMTSANLSGQADGVLVDLNLAVEQIGDAVDMVLRGNASNTTMSSTIITLAGSPQVLRHGDISQEHLNNVQRVFAP